MTVRPQPICKMQLAANDNKLTDTKKNESVSKMVLDIAKPDGTYCI